MKVIQEGRSTVEKERIGLTETSVKEYQHSLRNNTEELGSNLHPDGQFKSRKLVTFIINTKLAGHSSCQVQVPLSGRSFLQRSPTECGVPECHRVTMKRRPRPTTVVEP